MAFNSINSTQTDAKSPIDEQLMDVGVRQNFDDHESRILALESGGGGGGGGGTSDADPRFGKIVVGLADNIAENWEVTFTPEQAVVRNQNTAFEDDYGFNPELTDRNIFLRMHEPDSNKSNYFITTARADCYNSLSFDIPDNGKVVFTLPKGVNRFSLGVFSSNTGQSDSITVKIDGQTMSAFGMTDENYVARTDTFTTVTSAAKFQTQEHFWLPNEGATTKSHEILIENTATNSNKFTLESITIGYTTRNPAITLQTKITAGRAEIRGSEVNISATEVTHEARDGHGRTDAILSTNGGVVSVHKGISGAYTTLVAQETYDFTSPISTLTVKNTTEFSSSPRFMMLQMPNGGKHIFSRTGKTGNLRGTFTSCQWDSQPDISFIPENNFESGTAADATLTGMICEWAGGGYEVTSSSRFVDFRITYNGVQTLHAAQLNLGLYGTNFVKLSEEFNRACQAVKPITGRYFLEYNKEGKRWAVGVDDTAATDIEFLTSTGVNTASSLLDKVGFGAGDLTGATSYVAGSQSFDEEIRIYDFTEFRGYNHPTIKASNSGLGSLPSSLRDLAQYYGLPDFDYFNSASVVTIHPDPTSCGIILYLTDFSDGSSMTVEVDEDQQRFVYNCEQLAGGSSFYGPIQPIFIPYPRGSRLIRVYLNNATNFNMNSGTADRFAVVGYKQAITRPALETIPDTSAIIKLVDVNPPNYIGTPYSAEYTAGTNDQIDSITRSGGITTTTGSMFYNNTLTFAATSGQTYDVVFTLTQTGGIRIKGRIGDDATKVGFFMGSGAVPSEVGTRLTNCHQAQSVVQNGCGLFDSGPLPAGQYFLRWKSEGAGTHNLNEIIIYEDDFAVDRGRVVTALSGNNNKGVAFAMNHRIVPLIRDRRDRVGDALGKSRYQQGFTNNFDYQITSGFSYQNLDQNANLGNDVYYGNYIITQTVGDYYRMIYHGTNGSMLELCASGHTIGVEPELDGSTDTAYSTRVQTKGGAAPVGFGLQQELFFTDYRFIGTADMSNSTTFLTSDTKGVRPKQWGILSADGQPDVRVTVGSVSPGVSITFSTPVSGFANYTLANNVSFKQEGLHVLQFRSSSATSSWRTVAFKYAPLALEKSTYEKWYSDNRPDYEQKVELYRGVTNGDKLSRPVFDNGQLASFGQCTFNIVTRPSTITGWTIDDDFILSTTGTGDIDIQIIATRGNK